MKRLFLALWPDDHTRLAINAVIEQLQPTALQLYKPSSLHVTLVFLGNVDGATELSIRQKIDKLVAQAFSIQFDHLSYWHQPKVLCLTSQQYPPKALQELIQKVSTIVKSCGLNIELSAYNPHITLARKAGFKPAIILDPIIWKGHTFCLVESVSAGYGVEYRILQQWPLIEE